MASRQSEDDGQNLEAWEKVPGTFSLAGTFFFGRVTIVGLAEQVLIRRADRLPPFEQPAAAREQICGKPLQNPAEGRASIAGHLERDGLGDLCGKK